MRWVFFLCMILCILNSAGCGKHKLKPGWDVVSLGVTGHHPSWNNTAHLILYEQSDIKSDFFYSSNCSVPKVCVIDLDGSGYRQIAEGARPSWSPNGHEIGYCAIDKAVSGAQPVIYDLPSGKKRKLAKLYTTSQLIWVPSGNGFIFEGCISDGKENSWLHRWFFVPNEANPAPNEILAMEEGPVCNSRYFAVGMKGAAYAWAYSSGGCYAIYLQYGAELSHSKIIRGDQLLLKSQLSENKCSKFRKELSYINPVAGPFQPAWHPSEPRFVFHAMGSIWEMDVLSRSSRLLWPHKDQPNNKGFAFAPTYSHDGKRIAFLVKNHSGSYRLMCIDSDGNNEVLVANAVSAVEYSAGWLTPSYAWGPSSKCIIFTSKSGELKVASDPAMQ